MGCHATAEGRRCRRLVFGPLYGAASHNRPMPQLSVLVSPPADRLHRRAQRFKRSDNCVNARSPGLPEAPAAVACTGVLLTCRLSALPAHTAGAAERASFTEAAPLRLACVIKRGEPLLSARDRYAAPARQCERTSGWVILFENYTVGHCDRRTPGQCHLQ